MTENLTAYSGFESLNNYPLRDSLLAYREARVARYWNVVEFIRSRCPGQLPVSVVEIGSGSSALLYALTRAGMLERGIGVELADSRFEFAEQWKKDGEYSTVENVKANFTDIELEPGIWDWFVAIDNMLTYLYPENPGYPALMLKKARECLSKNGRLLIDFINYERRLPGVEYRDWSAFGQGDPFLFGLYSTRIVDGINASESIFVKRDGSEARRVERSKVYSLEELSALLESGGFAIEEVFANFDGNPYVANMSERLVVVATKHVRKSSG